MHAQHQSTSSHDRWTDFTHHLRAALVVGSVVSLLHAFSALGWLDGLMLKLVVGAGPQLRVGALGRDGPGDDMPIVLAIGGELYEKEFEQASPLNAGKFARLLHTLRQEGGVPKALVIDIDLSPGALDRPADPGRTALDAAIAGFASCGTRVVLPLPLRTATEASQRAKFDWLRRQCAIERKPDAALTPPDAGPPVRVGLPDVLTHQGAALKMQPGMPTLGVVAHAKTGEPDLCTYVRSGGERWIAPMLSSAFESSVVFAGAHGAAELPFNSRVFVAGDSLVHVLRSLDRLPQGTPSLAGRTVFVGAGYNPQDRFVVPAEGPDRPVEGVLVHAAVFDSLSNRVTAYEGLEAFAIDVVLGVAMGYVFAASWGWHRRVAAATQYADTFGALLRPRLTLLANFGLAAGLIVLCMVVANGLLFPANLWVNPGPIVLGLFVKFALSASGQQHGDEATAPPAARRLHRLDTLLVVVLTIVAAVVVHRMHA